MNKYPTSKDTEIIWIGSVPEHWNIKKIKHTTYVKGRIGWQALTTDEFIDEGAYLVTGTDFIDGEINWDTCYHVSEKRYNMDRFIQLKENDLLITKDGTIGKTVLVQDMSDKACLNSGIFVTRPLTKDYITEFMYWILNSKVFETFIDYIKTGSTISHLYQNVFENFSFPVPPIHEQKAISTFLGCETKKVNSLIDKKHKMLELLKEERTAIINQAVTKGLNSDASMIDSGIEWLGEIPEHWDIKPLKYIAKVQASNVDKKSDEGETEVLLCNYIDVYNNEFINNKIQFMKATALNREIEKFSIRYGDVLVTKDSETAEDIANAALVKENLTNILCGYHLTHIRPDRRYLLGEYLFRLFYVKKFNDQFAISANGVTRFGLSVYSFKNSYVSLPSISEQKEIIQFIEKEIKRIDKTILKIKEEIELLEEYRTALISEAVTGKIDVRNEV